MLDILHNWNRWGRNPLPSGHLRTITKRAVELLELPETVVLTGMRRTGKTTIIYQVMDWLEEQGVSQKAMLYVNFEDPSFSPFLNSNLLDKVYRTYREEVFPVGKAYLFLDEVQAVPEWERWVNARNETEDIKIFVSGSSAQIMSRELSTLLTGRHVDVRVHPLDFREYLAFNKIDLPKTPLPYESPPEIQAVLKNYLIWGGLPRIVLTDNEYNKRALLRSYLSDILFKDIALRHDIRNVKLLRDLAVFLLTQTSCRVTYKRLATIHNVSQSMIQNYCEYIEESFLINFLPLYSRKMAEVNRNPKKVHAHDLGFRHIANAASIMEMGKLTETCVYNQLNRLDHDGIYYWKAQGEVDQVLREGTEITTCIQVCYDGLDNDDTLNREINSLIEIHKQYPNAKKLLITAVWPKNLPSELPTFIEIKPLWRFLLGDSSNKARV